jgi:hypothetical protein
VAWNWRALTTMSAALRPRGADVLSADGRRVQLDGPAAREALGHHYDLVLKQQTATLPPLVADPLVAFADGRAASYLHHSGKRGGARRYDWRYVRNRRAALA